VFFADTQPRRFFRRGFFSGAAPRPAGVRRSGSQRGAAAAAL